MAQVKIGGTEYEVPELNFVALERAWPFVEESMTTLDPMKGPSAGIAIIAAGLIEADHFKQTDFGIGEEESLGEEQMFDRVVRFLKKKMKATEIESVRRCVEQITEEAGLSPPEGEPQPPQADQTEESLSTETVPDTSRSSSPQDAKEAAGQT